MLDLWRSFIEDKAGSDFPDLAGAINDQQAFAKIVRHMLASMNVAEDIGESGTRIIYASHA